jgi:hypothetical protein
MLEVSGGLGIQGAAALSEKSGGPWPRGMDDNQRL